MDLHKQLLAAFDVEHREHMDAMRRALDDARRGHEADMQEFFRRAHSLKGAARAVDLSRVEELAHQLEAVLSDFSNANVGFSADRMKQVEGLLDDIERAVASGNDIDRKMSLSGSEPAPATEPQADMPSEGSVDYLRIAAEHVGTLVHSMHDLSGELEAHTAVREQIDTLVDSLRNLEKSWLTLQKRPQPSVSTRHAPQLQGFGRGLADAARNAENLARTHRRAIWSIEQTAHRVKEDIDRIALVPASSVFGGFGRIIRELARDQNREVSVQISGRDVLADRLTLQQLKDPVLHLVRNSISHGAQSSEQRIAAGKPSAMDISIAFRVRAGRLIVTVADDGKGADLAHIARVATERGLMPAHETVPSPDQLLSYVLEPGFSTAPEVDRLSGRGMGLPIVAEAIRKLNGNLHLQTRPHGGLEATLSVPLVTALQPVVIVDVSDQAYALPTFAVERLISVRSDAIENIEDRLAARIKIGGNDVLVPIQPLSALLNSDGTPPIQQLSQLHLVVLRRGGRRFAVVVSAFREVRAMTIRSAAASGIDDDLVMGTVFIDRLTPALVLNAEALVERWVRHQSQLAASGIGLVAEKSATQSRRTILIVDDSITTRTLQRSILESQGYRVLLSVDGLHALETLRTSPNVIDLIIADVEMPRMDGFALLQALKNDGSLAGIPVIMMTSRADTKDVRRGLALGAGAYLTKQKFDQRDLLATVGQLL